MHTYLVTSKDYLHERKAENLHQCFAPLTQFFNCFKEFVHLKYFIASFSAINGKFDFRLKGGQLKVFRQVDKSVHDVGAKARVDVFRTKFTNALSKTR